MLRSKKKKSSSGQQLSEIAKKYNIRISNPYGYYPEDTDRLIEKLENQISILSTDAEQLQKRYEKLEAEYKQLKEEYDKQTFEMLKLDFSSNTSATEDYNRLEKLANINKDVGSIPDIQPVEVTESKVELEVLDDKSSDNPAVLENLVSEGNNFRKEQTKAKSIRETNKSLVNILDENGEIEIL